MLREIKVYLQDVPFYGTGDSRLAIRDGGLHYQGSEGTRLIDPPYDLRTLSGGPSAGMQDGPLASARFSSPVDVAVARDGQLFVADTGNNAIRRVTVGGVETIATGFDAPTAVVLEASGSLLVADTGNCKIRRVQQDGTVTTVSGSDCGYRDGDALQARFLSPTGLTVLPSGAIAVADTGNNCIRLIAGGTVNTIAGSPASGFQDGPGIDARFDQPSGLEFDPLTNRIVIADTGNHAVRALAEGLVVTIAGTGEPGDSDGAPGSSRFDGPTDVAIDDDGLIFVADTSNNVIRRISRDVITIAGSGWEGLLDGQGLSSRLTAPGGLTFANAALYVADTGNSAIRSLLPAP